MGEGRGSRKWVGNFWRQGEHTYVFAGGRHRIFVGNEWIVDVMLKSPSHDALSSAIAIMG